MHGNWSVAYGFTNCTFWLWRQCDKNSERAGKRGFAAAAAKQDGSHRVWEASVSTMMSHTTIKITTMSRVTDTLADFGCRGDGQHDSQQWDISYTQQGSGVQRRRSTHAIDYLFSHGQITVKKKPTESPLSTEYPRKQPFLPVGHQPPEAMDESEHQPATSKQPPRKSFE